MQPITETRLNEMLKQVDCAWAGGCGHCLNATNTNVIDMVAALKIAKSAFRQIVRDVDAGIAAETAEYALLAIEHPEVHQP